MLSGMSQFNLQRLLNFVTDPTTEDYGRKHSTEGRLYFLVQVPMPESRNGQGRAIINPQFKGLHPKYLNYIL